MKYQEARISEEKKNLQKVKVNRNKWGIVMSNTVNKY